MTNKPLSGGLLLNHPVFVLALALCPTLAMSRTLFDALAIGGVAFAVLLISEPLIAQLKPLIPERARLIVALLITATLITLADLLLQAFLPDISARLGIYLPLVAVSCLLLNRNILFATQQNVGRALLDALAMGFGYLWAIALLGTVREVLGAGSIAGITLFDRSYAVIIIGMAPGAFLVLGYLAALYNRFFNRDNAATPQEADV